MEPASWVLIYDRSESIAKMNLTDKERLTIQAMERIGASFSLVGIAFIIFAYAIFKRARTVPNTFILFASIANFGASIACLIGSAGLTDGSSSALCQTQAFLLEMFMQSDPWWSFAMAVNVYMIFFMAYHPSHRHMWFYCIICFGVPAIPATICLLYSPNGSKIYGDATMWCWIDDEHSPLRIYTYYVPIWTCIVLSAVIYIAVGYHVFRQRNQLRNLTLSNQVKEAQDELDVEFHPLPEKGSYGANYGIVTTEVRITAESSCSQTPPATPAASVDPVIHKLDTRTAPIHSWGSPPEDGIELITHTQMAQPRPYTTIATITTGHVKEEEAKHSYLRELWEKIKYKLHKLDPVKLAYLRTSFVFAISILVTWTPSSINRVYSFIYPESVSFSLNLASAIVLPLQGVWNAVIFIATSWGILKEETQILLSKWAPRFSPRDRSRDPSKRAITSDNRGHNPRGSVAGAEKHKMANIRVIRGGSL